MSEEKKIFDEKFVHFMWDDSLEGKEGFVSDSIDSLVARVNSTIIKTIDEQQTFGLVSYGNSAHPFSVDRIYYRFFYYDPLYNVKLAWKLGKTIQYRSHCSFKWEDCDDPGWSENYEYRVKPEEKKWRPFKDIQELKDTWHKCVGTCEPPPLFEPMIWVRDKKRPDITRHITGFNGGINSVALASLWNSLEALFEDYTFLDGTPCGVLESVEEEVEE